MQSEICWVKEKCIEDYIEKILSPSRHSLSLHRDSLSDKIWRVSSIFDWYEESNLFSIENKSTLNFSA